MTLFIGLGHYSRTGKDTFANTLIEELKREAPHLRAIKRPFAWKLKQVTYDLYAWAGVMPPEHYETPEGAKDRDVVLPALGMTPVELWVAFGTKAVRNQVYQATWRDSVLKTKHDADVVIIPDVRFPDEAEAIKETGGLLIKIVRLGYGPRKTVADRMLLNYDGWDYVLGNLGLLALKGDAWRFAKWIAGRERSEWPKQSPESRASALAVEVIEPWEES